MNQVELMRWNLVAMIETMGHWTPETREDSDKLLMTAEFLQAAVDELQGVNTI
jgi:hypothetical protein